MHQIVTDIEINARPAAVWSVLVDFPSYPDWNPFMRSVTGTPAEGERLTISLKPPNGREWTFHPVVLEATDNRELRWRGSLSIPGLFAGERFLRIDTPEPGKVLFTHGERFSGILVPAFKSYLNASIRAGFIEMNQALKSRAEHG
jgi:hypothetical protein